MMTMMIMMIMMMMMMIMMMMIKAYKKYYTAKIYEDPTIHHHNIKYSLLDMDM